MAISSRNPVDGEQIREYEPLTRQEVQARVGKAEDAFREFKKTNWGDRARWMAKAAELLEERVEPYASLMTEEMGKPIGQARGEIRKCALVCRHYSETAEGFLADRIVKTDAKRSLVRYQPLGIILAIMPWNFPFWQVFRFVAPGLMAGNVGLLKHASNVPGSALAIEEVLRDAGFPDGVFQTLLIGSDEIPALLEDSRVMAATLTGSEPAGRDVAARAGKELKKVVLELGGSDPFVVMPSADLDAAVESAVKARTQNNGQSCIAAKRFIVHSEIAEEFIERFSTAMSKLTVGDPMDEGTDIGPLATEQILDDLAEQVDKSVKNGAKIATGGKKIDRDGWFFEPTVLTDIPEGSPADVEELFGPVASVFVVDDIDAAIEKANDTSFGLGASAWTTNESEIERFTYELSAGSVFINAMVASNVHLPFGGIRNSGFGRELGEHGIHEFVNIKTVWIE